MNSTTNHSPSNGAAVKEKQEQAMPFSPAVGCLVSFLIAAVPVCLILGVVALALRGEFTFDLGPVREARVWMVREGQEQGIGLSTMKRTAGSERSGEVCYQSSVHFLLWRSLRIERQADYCECYQLDPNGWQYAGKCP
jgi:hypothetical protein